MNKGNNSIGIEYSPDLLNILLLDKTTGTNIKWACSDYEKYGYEESSELQSYHIIAKYGELIQSRAFKSKHKKETRTKNNAEVFTPSWICNEQNNLIDDTWFGRSKVFNIVTNESWITCKEKVIFPDVKGKFWFDYVDARRLEAACGEAPYLVSRYDAVSGDMIEVTDRIGLLDRKLRIVNENTSDEKEWYKWIIRAYQSIYGYEYQGDNVFRARENLLLTFIDNFKFKFNKEPKKQQLKKICNIITWNIWQMDGITLTTPFANSKPKLEQINMFSNSGNIEKEDRANYEMEPVYSQIKDWRDGNGKIVTFKSIIKGDNDSYI